jgi:hypothetical protein
MPDINLSPYTSQMEALAQRRKMAELLSQQAMQPLEMPQVAGARISPYAGLAKMLQAYTGRTMREEAQAEQKALADQYRTDTSADFSSLLAGLTPKAAVPEGPSTFTPNVSQIDATENPRMQMMMERGEDGGIIQEGEPGAGYFGVTPGTPAIPATAGELSAKGFKAMKTREGQQQYMAQLLAQIAPKEGMVLPEGASYITKGGKVLIQGAGKDKFGNIDPSKFTPESIAAFTAGGSKDFSLLRAQPNLNFQKTGTAIQAFNPITGAAVGAGTPLGVSADAAAKLKQDREISDRAFNGLSANQKAQLGNEAKRLNMTAEQLFFDTGIRVGGGVPNAPVTGAAPFVSGQPANMPAPIANAPSALSPKAQQTLLIDEAQAKAKKERGMQGIGNVIDEARKIMTGKAVDQQGKEIKTPLPTQSFGGQALDFVSGAFGESPQGAAQADQLKVLGGALLSSVPRMEGPQGEKDVQLYREMAGQIGDSGLPVARRLKALDMVEALYRKYDRTSPTPPQIPDAPPPGAVRRVR